MTEASPERANLSFVGAIIAVAMQLDESPVFRRTKVAPRARRSRKPSPGAPTSSWC